MSPESIRKRPSRKRNRQAAAIVELAVCLPVLVLLAMATVEACSVLYLKQSLKIASYESTRVGLVPTARAENVTAQADLILGGRNIKDYTVTLTPADPRSMEQGDFFRVEVVADCGANSFVGGWFYTGKTVRQATEMVAE